MELNVIHPFTHWHCIWKICSLARIFWALGTPWYRGLYSQPYSLRKKKQNQQGQNCTTKSNNIYKHKIYSSKLGTASMTVTLGNNETRLILKQGIVYPCSEIANDHTKE